ncbi:hypothetical protein [Chitinophaga nivalis]|uniref:Growth inhibitor PemK n=1 Tax=Chitinophaga nivalis TaxID=2991709 RepID=A0ABT3IPL8_9BACT|nr:hypothetical protein [Chitinophaga nivalis]MCW3464416.1 hypothetical protein [Chitinophaga nivalis]MCW3485893.1 hypothetical protein [Chitinophaga nivalis]
MLEIKVIAARIHFATQRVIDTESAVFFVKTGEVFHGAACHVDVPGTGTLVVLLQVRGMQQDHTPSGNRKYFAADIIAVQSSQILPQVPHRQIGQKRPLLKLLSEEIAVVIATQLLLSRIQRE